MALYRFLIGASLNVAVQATKNCIDLPYKHTDLLAWQDFFDATLRGSSSICADNDSFIDPCCNCDGSTHPNIFVQCVLNNGFKEISEIVIRKNDVKGEVPLSLKSMKSLSVLDLRGNPGVTATEGRDCFDSQVMCQGLRRCDICNKGDRCASLFCEGPLEADKRAPDAILQEDLDKEEEEVKSNHHMHKSPPEETVEEDKKVVGHSAEISKGKGGESTLSTKHKHVEHKNGKEATKTSVALHHIFGITLVGIGIIGAVLIVSHEKSRKFRNSFYYSSEDQSMGARLGRGMNRIRATFSSRLQRRDSGNEGKETKERERILSENSKPIVI